MVVTGADVYGLDVTQCAEVRVFSVFVGRTRRLIGG